MERGTLTIVSIAGSHGKPRPAVVIQNDEPHAPQTVLVCLVTSDLDDHAESRLIVQPSAENGLRMTSLVMTEKIYPVPRSNLPRVIGRLDPEALDQLDAKLAFVLGLGA